MVEETQQPALQPEAEARPDAIVRENISPPPKESKRNLWIGLAIAIAGICACSLLCIGLVATAAGRAMLERAPVETVLDSYMKYMAAQDFESAYALFSPRAQRQIPLSRVQELTEGNNYVVFEGYQSLSIENINLTGALNTNPDAPQGTVATVNGSIFYAGGFEGTFRATLQKVNGEWHIDGVYVTVPPNKFQP